MCAYAITRFEYFAALVFLDVTVHRIKAIEHGCWEILHAIYIQNNVLYITICYIRYRQRTDTKS